MLNLILSWQAKTDAISGSGTPSDGILMAQAISADTPDATYIVLKPLTDSSSNLQNHSRYQDLITWRRHLMINKEGETLYW